MPIDPVAAGGFQAGAGAYQRARPDYPADAVARLAEVLRLGPGTRVVDLGAGTGVLTASLVPTGADVIAVEPVAAMRARLAASLTGVRVIAGLAEAIPIADASVDAVVAAQAFHWFDASRALPEIRRVLRPGSRLGLVWNVRDHAEPWVAEMAAIVDAYGDAIRRHESGEWRDAFEGETGFGPLGYAEFGNVQQVSPEQVVERVASTSFIAILPPAEREQVSERIRTLIATHPGTAGSDRIAFPHRTRVWWCERR